MSLMVLTFSVGHGRQQPAAEDQGRYADALRLGAWGLPRAYTAAKLLSLLSVKLKYVSPNITVSSMSIERGSSYCRGPIWHLDPVRRPKCVGLNGNE
ncbi:uncharacterized protein TRAVEDRAFT_54581 [Trametes versicolor FP-101664 SS1]|uniref:Uncharacterized protein n=1 Tax=Trametes versicolor (strain FP-101664) TaxID=717944 RepID=R7S8X3_TRAVS|nr:uncharacterized protein TRAVEDRAFT_54581 [Trametes versicolor FP-101664 SS1]EIW51424.1 hypothetical protein TRAVEDRAFT_54581 [Trametes versicolor FP-101664 SS1]